MPDFDEQWKKVMGKEYFENNTDQFGLTKKILKNLKN